MCVILKHITEKTRRSVRITHLILAKEVDGTRQQSYLTADNRHVDDWYVERRYHSATAANCTDSNQGGNQRDVLGVHPHPSK